MKTKNLLKSLKRRLGLITAILAMLLVGQGMMAYDWTANKTLYYDNTSTSWSNVYMRIGRQQWSNDYSSAYKMTKVTGTANLYKYTVSSKWENYDAFGVANNSGWTGTGNDIYKLCTGDGYQITGHTNYIKVGVTTDYTIVAGSISGTDNCTTFYSETHYASKKTWSASITAPSNGTISVSYKNESGTTVSYISGSKDVLPTCTITVTASPSTGYKLKSLTVGGASISSGGTYNVRSNVSIAAEFEVDCSSNHATATTGSATNINASGASLAGTFTAGGTSVTAAGFAISKTSGSGYTNYAGTISSSNVTLTKTELDANTKYYYKTYVTDGCGTYYGTESSFTTAPGSIYVRGPIMGDNGDGGSSECWNNANYYEMQNNGSNVFTKTFNPSGNYCDYGPKEFVLTMESNDDHKLNPDWFGSKTGCQKSSRQDEGNNFESTLKYSNADQLTLTVTWNGDEDYTISLAKTNNKPSNLYIKGPLVDGNWDGGYKQPGYTKNGDTYVFTFEAKTGGDAREFCISSTQGDKGKIHYTTTKGTYAGWDFKDTQEGKNFVASDQIVTRDNFPIKVTVTYVGGAEYDFTLDIESNGCEKPTLSLTMPYSSGKIYNQITANAQITNMGTCTINEFGVEAFSDASCEHRVSYKTGSTSSTDEQHLVVTGLTANTKYWFRAYAKTDDGDTYSSVVTDFTRVNAEKMSATNITSSSATLQGKALVDGGFATELKSNAVFKYGTTNVVGDATSVTSSSKAIGSVITYNLSGLAAGTTYYYWFCPTTTDGSHPTTPNYSMNSFTTNRVHDPIVLDNKAVCVGADITLNPSCSTATAGFTYSSNNTSVATVDASGKVHGVAAGTATVTVTTKEVSGYDVATKDITVTVNAIPTLTSITGPDNLCKQLGGAGTYTTQEVAGGVYAWESNLTGVVGWSNTYSTQCTTGGTTGTGYISVYVTDANGCRSNTVKKESVSVVDRPTITPGHGSVCGSGTVTLTATPSAGTVTWYSAATGGTSLKTGTSYTTPSISVTTDYYAETDNSGCKSAAREKITATVNPLPAQAGSLTTKPENPCKYSEQTYGVASTAGCTYTWKAYGTSWSVSGTPTTPTATLTVGESGSDRFGIVVTDANGCKSAEQKYAINDVKYPSVTVTASPTSVGPWEISAVTVTPSAGTAAVELWKGGSKVSPTATDVVFEGAGTAYKLKAANKTASPITYTIKAKATLDGCTGAESSQNVTVTKAATEQCQ